MRGSMLHKVRGSPARKGQQSQNCEPKARLLRTTSHGTLLWQVAKSTSLNGMNAFISGLLTALSFLQKPTIEIETASPKSCRSLWHLHFEQCCRQTCVSSCLEGTCHLGRVIWAKLTRREFWAKPIPMKLSHNTYPDIQRELYFKPRISENPKTLKEMTPYRIKQEMDEDVFDQMVEALHQSNNPHNPPTQATTRWKPDGSYGKKPLDLDYFSKYYQKKLSRPFRCPDCG